MNLVRAAAIVGLSAVVLSPVFASGSLATTGAADVPAAQSIRVGTNPIGVVVAPDGGFTYVANSTDATVSKVSNRSDKVVATIPTDAMPHGICVTPDSQTVYVANQIGNSVTKIDTSTNRVAATIPLAPRSMPLEVAASPDGRNVYVSNFGTGEATSVTQISTKTNESRDLEVPSGPAGIVVSPDSNFIYVTHSGTVGGNTVSKVDVGTGEVRKLADVKSDPNDVAVTPDGRTLVVTCQNGKVFRVDAATGSTASIDLGRAAHVNDVAIDSSGRRAYVTSLASGTVTTLDIANLATVDELQVGDRPYGLALSADGSAAFVALNDADEIVKFATASRAPHHAV